MPALPTLGLFLLAALGLLLFPGPSVFYVVTRSMAQGRRAGLASVLGIEAATFTHTIAAALGLSALLLTSALAFNVVKYVGAAYLIFLGIRTLLARHEQQQTADVAPRSFSRLFTQGFLVNLLNPKTALFFYAFLPQFVDPARGAVVVQILVLGGLFVALACCTDGLGRPLCAARRDAGPVAHTQRTHPALAALRHWRGVYRARRDLRRHRLGAQVAPTPPAGKSAASEGARRRLRWPPLVAQQAFRALVRAVHDGFDAVQAHLIEGEGDDRAERLAHDAPPPVRPS
jgi:threonine/homoserine/homoserine lactone efflux protein